MDLGSTRQPGQPAGRRSVVTGSAAGPASSSSAGGGAASGLAAAVSQGLWRLVDAVKRQQRRLEKERRHEGGERQRPRAAPKKETTSDEQELAAGSPGATVVELASSAEFGGAANGSSHDHAQLLGGEAGASAAAAAAGNGNGGTRRVAFETTVRTDSGSSLPLRTESATERSSFVRGVGPVYRDMDGLKQYAAPWGYQLVERLTPHGRGFSLATNRFIVLALTFLCYTAYHASRKPPSIVKSVLHGDAQADGSGLDHYDYHWASSHEGVQVIAPGNSSDVAAAGGANATLSAALGREAAAGWAPFNHQRDGKALLGQLDLAFLGAYAFGMFVSGHLGDRVDLRYFLTGGMLGSGVCVSLFGAAYFWQIHSMTYFIAVQVVGGLLQATGWPSVVSVMANWFGKGKRGLIMGVWNAHTSVGNIVGSLIAAYMLRYGWGWSFVVPGAFIAISGLVIFSFLVVEPQDIGFLPQSGSVLGSEGGSEPLTPRSEASDVSAMSAEARAYLERHLANIARGRGGLVPAHVQAQLDKHHTIHGGHGKHGLWGMGSTLVLQNKRRDSVEGSEADLLLGGSPRSDRTFMSTRDKAGVSFWAAWAIPGVAVFALTLFFAKLVAYTFLYWLPYYISTTEVGGRSLTPSEAGNLSILFDVGGVLGGAIAGWLSDASGASALVSFSFVFSAIPFLYLYRVFGEVSFAVNIGLMMAAGFFVNGPYALITTAVSADLGTHKSLAGNEKALATVTAIIDGMGSIGAAIGPMMTGYISELPGGFDNVFYMLYGAAAAAGLLLTGLVFKEVREMVRRRRRTTSAADGLPAEGLLTEGETVASDQFSFLPPGVPAGGAVRTIDNETGVVV
ncbi:hypothetical protein ABPG75_012121 [Micractinium tetrahymenae]